MTKLIYSLILGLGLFACLFANADDIKRGAAILSWTSQKVDKGFILSNELYNQKFCNKIYSKQIPEFLKKNPSVKDPNKFSPGDEIMIQTCMIDGEKVLPKKVKPTPVVTEWMEVKTKSTFVLKEYIQKESGCVTNNSKKDLSEQIKIFKQKNPLVSNVDDIPEDTVLSLQRCPASTEAPEVANAENPHLLLEAKGSPTFTRLDQPQEEIVVADNVNEINNAMSSGSDNANLQIGAATGSAQSSSDVSSTESNTAAQYFSVGILAESGKDISPAVGYRLRAAIYEKVEYQARIDLDPHVFYFNHQINFMNKKKDGETPQTFIAFGLGQRYSLESEKTDTNQNRGVDMYPFLGVGYRRDFKDSFLEAQIGANLAKNFSPNLSIIGLRRLGETHFMIGGYGDYRTSKSIIENTQENKKYITGGLIFSY